MSEIDWSKAPEGATHCTLKPKDDDMYRSVFWRVVDGKAVEAWPVGDDWSDQGHFEYGPEGCGAYLLNTSVERPSSSWTGAGLPPVGTVCEYYIDDGKWRQCEVVAHKDGYAVIWITAAHVFSSRSCGLLRPLRTPEQIEAEEREKAVRELSAIISSKIIDRSAAVAIYEAGYRKQGEAK